MSDTQRGICPECGTEQLVNQNGRIRKHGDCQGAGQPPASEDNTPPAETLADEPEQAADPASQDDADGDWDDDPDLETSDGETEPAAGDPPTPAGPDGEEQPPVEELGYGKDAFRWEITVAQPAIYLDDPAWHAANSLMAAQDATDAGHVPAGEAQCTAVAATEDGTGLTLTYLLPIDTES